MLTCSPPRSWLGTATGNLVDIGFSYTATDDCTPAANLRPLVTVYSDRPEETPAQPDATFHPLQLRADKPGRTYVVAVTASDEAGNAGFACCAAQVAPYDEGAVSNAVSACQTGQGVPAGYDRIAIGF